jgi:hypothetical protein
LAGIYEECGNGDGGAALRNLRTVIHTFGFASELLIGG